MISVGSSSSSTAWLLVDMVGGRGGRELGEARLVTNSRGVSMPDGRLRDPR